MSTYTTVSTASNDGTAVHAHPDVGTGLGVGTYQTYGAASMVALQTAPADKAWVEIGLESDVISVCGGDTFVLSSSRSSDSSLATPRPSAAGSLGGFQKIARGRRRPRPRSRPWDSGSPDS